MILIHTISIDYNKIVNEPVIYYNEEMYTNRKLNMDTESWTAVEVKIIQATTRIRSIRLH